MNNGPHMAMHYIIGYVIDDDDARGPKMFWGYEGWSAKKQPFIFYDLDVACEVKGELSQERPDVRILIQSGKVLLCEPE